jgi:hypothetical protein
MVAGPVFREQVKMLTEEREALAVRLKEILDEQAELSAKMQKAVCEYDRETANRMATEAVGVKRDWLAATFGDLR